jgi:hypothetical protein
MNMGTLLTDIPELSGSIQSSATPSVSSPAAQSSGKASTGSFADAMEQANGSGSTSAESVDSKSSAATANEAEDNNVTNASLQYGRNSAREEDWRTMASLTPEQRKNATESVPVTKPVQREDQSRRSADRYLREAEIRDSPASFRRSRCLWRFFFSTNNDCSTECCTAGRDGEELVAKGGGQRWERSKAIAGCCSNRS